MRSAGAKPSLRTLLRRSSPVEQNGVARQTAHLPSPYIFVCVASKGLRVHVSVLESTHAGISISVDSKGLEFVFRFSG
jgi:hypothetical protein